MFQLHYNMYYYNMFQLHYPNYINYFKVRKQKQKTNKNEICSGILKKKKLLNVTIYALLLKLYLIFQCHLQI